MDPAEVILGGQILDGLRGIHYPVAVELGAFDHRWVTDARRVAPQWRTADAILDWVEAQLPDHQPSSRWPGECDYDHCGQQVLKGPVCAFCGGGMDEGGDWYGQLWPCPTAALLGLDLNAPACTCPYVWRAIARVHDPDCSYAGWLESLSPTTR